MCQAKIAAAAAAPNKFCVGVMCAVKCMYEDGYVARFRLTLRKTSMNNYQQVEMKHRMKHSRQHIDRWNSINIADQLVHSASMRSLEH